MISYKDAGVDKEAGYEHVQRLKSLVAQTHNPHVLNGLGSFAALYQLGHYRDPVLVSGTDGVGTKLKLAFNAQVYDTVGIDLVAMCVNDVLCHGARPAFFLDYLACSKLDPKVSEQLVAGIAAGCKQAGAALIGGETAEMPGFYARGEYDMAGFCVGVVERDEIIDGSQIRAGDLLFALPSSGVHSNGYSLIRRIFKEYPDELLEPTRIYVPDILSLLDAGIRPHGLAHITGGGLIENVPRMIPDGLVADIARADVRTPDIYSLPEFLLVPETEMWGTFNMGVGFVIAVDPAAAHGLTTLLPQAYQLGRVIPAADVADDAQTQHTSAHTFPADGIHVPGLWLH